MYASTMIGSQMTKLSRSLVCKISILVKFLIAPWSTFASPFLYSRTLSGVAVTILASLHFMLTFTVSGVGTPTTRNINCNLHL
jgi:hypothetical protein